MIPKGLLRNVVIMVLAAISGAVIGELIINHGVLRLSALAGGLIGGVIGGWLMTKRWSTPQP